MAESTEESAPSPMKLRLVSISQHLGISMRKFEENCNFPRGRIGGMGETVGIETLINIKQMYPQFDLYWIMTGIGTMLSNDPNLRDKYIAVLEQNMELNKEVNFLRSELERMKISAKAVS